MKTPFLGCVVLVISAFVSSDAAAQPTPAFRPKQIVFSGGVLTSGGYGAGDVTAELRRNATGTATPFTLLVAESELGTAIAVEGRVGVALSNRLLLEVGGSFARPELGVTITQDAEAPSGGFASSGVDQYIVDVSAVYQLPVTMGRRATTYAIGGGGYLRQLHAGRLAVETGSTIHVGAGLQYWFRSGPKRRPLGARGEVRYVRRHGGIEFEDRGRGFPTISVLAFVGL